MIAHRTKRGTMTQQELDTILESHKKWLASAAKNEVQADLSNLDLRGLVFQGASLKKAILRKSDLSGVDLYGMDLSGADLSDSELIGCNLRKAVLRDSDFRGAKLKDAQLCDADLCGATLHEVNLTTAHGLVERQLAGTDLSNAELPAGLGKFDALGKVTDVSVQARTLLWVTVGACLFALITMFITTDALIVAHSGLTLLPLVNINVPVFKFFLVWPLILLGLYMYLHFQLQYLWTALASLPSVFPDGVSLDERAYPLFLVGLVRWHIPILKKFRPPLYWSQGTAAIGAVWLLVPVTLFLFWLEYVRMHEWWGTGCHLVAFLITTGFGLVTYSSTARTLSGERNPMPCADEQKGRNRPRFGAMMLVVTVLAAAVVIICISLSVAAFRGSLVNPEWLKPWFCVDFSYGEISHKPDDWLRLSEENPTKLSRIVKGALLSDVNLRGATGIGSFLVNATLDRAHLQWADLSYADLRACDLTRADLQHAQLLGSDLRGAHLTDAQLQRSYLKSAILSEAILSGAKLNGTDLFGAELLDANLTGANLAKAILGNAKLNGADFSGAWFQETVLHGADLSQAKNLDEKQLSGAFYDEDTKLPAGLGKAAEKR
jgi:uncharacterized protein YjbI with pentapeptide repeats